MEGTEAAAPEIVTASELAATDALMKKWIMDANGDLKPSDVTIKATGMTAEEFIEKFHEITKDKQLMLAAEPEHYLMSVENGKIGDAIPRKIADQSVVMAMYDIVQILHTDHGRDLVRSRNPANCG